MVRPLLVCTVGFLVLSALLTPLTPHAYGSMASYCCPQIPICGPPIVPLSSCCVPTPLFPPPPPLVVPIVVAPPPPCFPMPPMPIAKVKRSYGKPIGY